VDSRYLQHLAQKKPVDHLPEMMQFQSQLHALRTTLRGGKDRNAGRADINGGKQAAPATAGARRCRPQKLPLGKKSKKSYNFVVKMVGKARRPRFPALTVKNKNAMNPDG
jgi:hypothetical protein